MQPPASDRPEVMPAPEIAPPVAPTPPIPSEPPPIAPSTPAQPTPPTTPEPSAPETPILDPRKPDIMAPGQPVPGKTAATPPDPVELHRAEANTIARHSRVRTTP